ncbi:LuxR family transcriptional regulator [Burkholderia territorii]|uniref:LuxR family transcriptional regulator n=1 Tax=Burkholderia territorii TaxID=1503055 RepID=A0A125BS12_9BURK|nr:response regulator [Burkholderia territorii]KVV52634.1 LuxR family transcriptional regulator [Burkholderia territorii]KVX41333.1 LuxR family transcriptional regulator [Burkholderia territorii]
MTEGKAIDVILADDHPAMILGLANALESYSTIRVGETAANSTELVAALEVYPCDVLVSDYSIPGGEYGDELALFAYLRRRYPKLAIVVLTMRDDYAMVSGLLKLGVECILCKTDALMHLNGAIYGAYAGARYFSPRIFEIVCAVDPAGTPVGFDSLSVREAEVIRLFLSGMNVNEIAKRTCRTKQTISTQKGNAMRKLGLERDSDLFKYAMGASMALSSVDETSTEGQGS